MRYLLDTNVCVDYLTGRYPAVIRRLQSTSPEDLAVSVIAVAELRYGASKSARAGANHRKLDHLLEDLPTLPFDLDATDHYGKLRSRLERAGTPIGPNDMLIVAQALSGDLVLVTDNVAEFARVDEFAVENWRGDR